MAEAIGHNFEDLPVAWNQRDLLLYAVGVGAKADEFTQVYELSPDWSPLPTYPLVLALKGDSQDVTDYSVMKDYGGSPPGLPALDPKKLVHAEQTIEILRPLPHSAAPGAGWKLKKQLTGIHDKGKGLIVEATLTLVDGQGQEYARMISSSYNFGKYNLGVSKAISKPVLPNVKVPKDRKPDFELAERTTPEQAIIYRLSGDSNSFGKGMGFPGTILHGLCSYGHAARAIIKYADGKPDRLVKMTGRFVSPVIPGDELVTTIWAVGDSKGEKQLAFTQTVKSSGKVCLQGAASIKAANASKL